MPCEAARRWAQLSQHRQHAGGTSLLHLPQRTISGGLCHDSTRWAAVPRRGAALGHASGAALWVPCPISCLGRMCNAGGRQGLHAHCTRQPPGLARLRPLLLHRLRKFSRSKPCPPPSTHIIKSMPRHTHARTEPTPTPSPTPGPTPEPRLSPGSASRSRHWASSSSSVRPSEATLGGGS